MASNLLAVGLAGLVSVGCGWLFMRALDAPAALPWVCAALASLGCVLVSTGKGLLLQRAGPSHRLGAADRITLLRGIMICWLAGFALMPEPTGELAWAPAVLFAVVVILDVIDGSVARRMGETSRFGEALDREIDAIGTLAAVAVAASYGRLPWFYAGVALLPFAFAATAWALKQLQRPVVPLRPDPLRRAIGAAQFTFLVVALLPLPVPLFMEYLSIVLGLLVTVSVARDGWQVVERALPSRSGSRTEASPVDP